MALDLPELEEILLRCKPSNLVVLPHLRVSLVDDLLEAPERCLRLLRDEQIVLRNALKFLVHPASCRLMIRGFAQMAPSLLRRSTTFLLRTVL